MPARQTRLQNAMARRPLFAALNMLDGTVISDYAFSATSRHQEVYSLPAAVSTSETPLDLDSASDRRQLWNAINSRSRRILAETPSPLPLYISFPTSSSWLNMVERWFREDYRQAHPSRLFQNVPDLIAAINHYIEPTIRIPSFHLERIGRTIMGKIAKCKKALETLR